MSDEKETVPSTVTVLAAEYQQLKADVLGYYGRAEQYEREVRDLRAARDAETISVAVHAVAGRVGVRPEALDAAVALLVPGLRVEGGIVKLKDQPEADLSAHLKRFFQSRPRWVQPTKTNAPGRPATPTTPGTTPGFVTGAPQLPPAPAPTPTAEELTYRARAMTYPAGQAPVPPGATFSVDAWGRTRVSLPATPAASLGMGERMNADLHARLWARAQGAGSERAGPVPRPGPGPGGGRGRPPVARRHPYRPRRSGVGGPDSRGSLCGGGVGPELEARSPYPGGTGPREALGGERGPQACGGGGPGAGRGGGLLGGALHPGGVRSFSGGVADPDRTPPGDLGAFEAAASGGPGGDLQGGPDPEGTERQGSRDCADPPDGSGGSGAT